MTNACILGLWTRMPRERGGWWVELWLLMTIGNVWTRGGRRRAGLDMEWEMGTKLKAASNHNAEERWKHPKREWWSRTYARCVMHVNLPLSLLLPIIFDYICTGSCHRYILLVSHNPSESTNLAKWKYVSNVGTKSNHQLAESLFIYLLVLSWVDRSAEARILGIMYRAARILGDKWPETHMIKRGINATEPVARSVCAWILLLVLARTTTWLWSKGNL